MHNAARVCSTCDRCNSDATGKDDADARAGVAATIQRGGDKTRVKDVFTTPLPKSVVGIQDHLRSILENDAPTELKKLLPGVTQPTPWPDLVWPKIGMVTQRGG
jgi:hypothetical protein